MNTFKETFKKYKFINLTVIFFYSFMQIVSIILFPKWLYEKNGAYPFNPCLLSGGLSILGIIILVVSVNGIFSKQSKNKKIICYIGILLGFIALFLGAYQEICNAIDLLDEYNSFNWSPNVITDTREHNVLSFFFIAPIFCYILFIVAAVLYIRELIKQTKLNKQAQENNPVAHSDTTVQ